MPQISDPSKTEYNQESFIGGMNLLGDDTRLQPNQYRVGFNLTNRFDELDLILQSVEDVSIPKGIIQECITFGDYILLFVSGACYFRFYNLTGWTRINAFSMSSSAPRYWTIPIPVAATNYVRIAATGTANSATSNSAGGIQLSTVIGASGGNLPGLLVQDNLNQPQFIFLDSNGVPQVRTTQTINQWMITFTDETNVTVAPNGDQREYVPIGNSMAWSNGILFVASQDGNTIYRSVSGRPLDFVVNVVNTLSGPTTTTFAGAVGQPFTQYPGGAATTTSYSVGVGGITTLRAISTGIFVGAGLANFAVTLNTTQNAPTIFGEYTFIRTFLFNATCLSDRAIFDSNGDTRLVELNGVRSFNAIEQLQNEGRNSQFTLDIQAAFDGITQSADSATATLFDNYELYAMESIFGPVIAKYDTINECWTSFDINQTDGKLVKIFAKIELDITQLVAITVDNRLFTLYQGPTKAIGFVRPVGICANLLYANSNIKMNNPKIEIQLRTMRIILNKLKANCTTTFLPYVNNRLSSVGTVTKTTTYKDATIVSTNPLDLPDINTFLQNVLFSMPNCEQGWKVSGLISWNEGVITQYSFEFNEVNPMNPLLTQGVTV